MAATGSEEDASKFNTVPILIDWDNGVVAVDNEALAIKILKDRAEEQ